MLNPSNRILLPLVLCLLVTARFASAEYCRYGAGGVPATLIAPSQMECIDTVGQRVHARLKRALTQCLMKAGAQCPAEQRAKPATGTCSYGRAQIAKPLIADARACERRVCLRETQQVRSRLRHLLASSEQCSNEGPSANPPGMPLCIDRCGDGVCDEVVCLAQGCPCVEDAKRCPADCGQG